METFPDEVDPVCGPAVLLFRVLESRRIGPAERVNWLWTVLTEYQDLKDFARNSGQLDVVYSETGRDRDGKG
ncbi:hypothetical protein CLCR_02685 [Cladophialophora carrionii]|uniref:Uncharacterized protein n=1 Tax=Cladophialophora carrionii TaxID=86049 RepID=A0A1C1CEZ1_9EURO|nr:hypothetical protein CLCR_02685 [Cladophialophora carrionii]